MEDNQFLNQEHAQQFQAILSAIDNYIGKKGDTEEWKQADDQMNEALNNFQFEFTLDQIKEILKHAENVIRFGNYFVLKILGKCPDGILDQEAAENLLQKHCVLSSDDFDKSLNKVAIEYREEVKEKICANRFQAILSAIDNFYGISQETETERFDKMNIQFAKALENFEFEFTLEQIKEILRHFTILDFILGRNYVFKILDKCPDEILDQEAAENLLQEHCKDLNDDDDYEYFLRKCNKELKIVKEFSLKKESQQNKKLGIFGIVGVIIGGLSGLAAIGLGAAVGIGALAVTIVAPIVAPIAVVSLVLLGIFGYVADKFRADKEVIKIKKAKLNGQSINENEIQFDLRKRRKIQKALADLDESKKPLLQNAQERQL